ncbi:hypothetical protein CEXT_705181 [Caerostris extrusa]|uniref:Uncharacterized protein n=1 Tax=Caerostris extrusa TaxID=172846 RepID=A0AAV4RNC1_CAEEX|nr:hypothetical protein CEXT_705181 [Caerostris extrusa]
MPLREMTWSVPEKEGRSRPRVMWRDPIKTTQVELFGSAWAVLSSAATLSPPKKNYRDERKHPDKKKKCVRTTCYTSAVRRRKKRSTCCSKKRIFLCLLFIPS